MIALVPQTEQRHRSANGLAALAPQSQLVSGCFAMAFLVLPAHRICRIIAIPFSILTCKVCLSPTMSVRGENVHPVDRKVFERMDPHKHGFRLDCLLSSFGGRLRDAPVGLLYLSPGFGGSPIARVRFRYPVMCSLRTPPAHPTDRTMRASA